MTHPLKRSLTLAIAALVLPLAATATPLTTPFMIELAGTTLRSGTLDGMAIPAGTAYTFTALASKATSVPSYGGGSLDTTVPFDSSSFAFAGFSPVTVTKPSGAFWWKGNMLNIEFFDDGLPPNGGFGAGTQLIRNYTGTFPDPLDFSVPFSMQGQFAVFDGGGVVRIATSGGNLDMEMSGETSLGTFTVTPVPAPVPVPEPGTFALMLASLGVVGVVAARRTRRENEVQGMPA